MSGFQLSKGEIKFFQDGIHENLREDGRRTIDYRCLKVDNDVVPQSFGSSRVHLGNTDVLCSIKINLGVPTSDKPNEGILHFNVFFGSNIDAKEKDKLALKITSYLESAYESNDVFDKRSFCIVHGKKCWVLNIDILIVNDNGNIIDAAGIAIKSAFYNTFIPKIKSIDDNGSNDFQIEMDFSLKSGFRLNIENFPIFVTLRKIGSDYIVDPTINEEKIGSFGLIVALSANKIVGIFKIGSSSTDLSHLFDNLKMALKIGQSLNRRLIDYLSYYEEHVQIPNYSFF